MSGEHPWRDEETLREKYIAEGKSTSKIGDELGCSNVTITNWLDRHGIKTRDSGGAPSDAPYKDKERLDELYHGEGLSAEQIAERLDCSKASVLRWMQKHGIDRRRQKTERPPGITMHSGGYERVSVTINGESKGVLLHRLLAVAVYGFEVVQEHDVHHKKNIPWLNTPENLELVSKEDHPSKHAKNSETPWKDKETLHRMIETNTQTELAEKWNCNQSMISRWLKRHELR